jgi:hypothetical protein
MGFGENLNVPTTNGGTINLEKGGLFTVNRARIEDSVGTHHKVDLSHVPQVFRGLIRDFHDLLRQKKTSSLYCKPPPPKVMILPLLAIQISPQTPP